ncbi:MAG TPA: aminotransferase class I/II-fold pyridoxal phosphate-dependent enzyme [Vicinamibacteria bacterium]|nr:aminotransferase class I/II-fold pyridoxal phosphate-dependent enzyme [Vicinamibacteria bacterium]
METHGEFERRAFLKSAGLTTLFGAIGAGGAGAAWAGAAPPDAPARYDFDEVYRRVGTECTKWDKQLGRFGPDSVAVGMGIADMDFRAAPCITRALAERCRHENWGYMDPPRSYVDSVVAWNKRRYGLEIDPATLEFSMGVHPALIAALHTFAPPGSRVLMLSPAYDGFYSDLTFTRTLPEDCPMPVVDGRYTIDFDDFERRARRTNLFILCNPHNPTGNCWSPEDLTRMGEICLKHRVVVLADEIHCDFVSKGHRYTPFASLPNRDIVDNSLTFKAASKTFSLAAMKSAWFFSTNPDYLARVKANNRVDLNTLGIVANRAAMTEGGEWLDQLLPYIDQNHEFVARYAKDRLPLVKYAKAEGTYLAWLDVSGVVDRIGAKQAAAAASRSSATPVTPEMVVERWFVEHARVHMNPGSSYGTGGAGHMRMNLGTSRKLIALALDNLARALNEA